MVGGGGRRGVEPGIAKTGGVETGGAEPYPLGGRGYGLGAGRLFSDALVMRLQVLVTLGRPLGCPGRVCVWGGGEGECGGEAGVERVWFGVKDME